MRALLLILALVGIPLAPQAVAAPRPNIIFVLTDDMGYSDLNCYGGNFAPTPNLDRLARQGTRFTHFYDDAPICSPSRASYITGMFPARWNFTNYLDSRLRNRDSEQADFLPTSAPALARVLKAAGYATGHFGKWHLGGGRDVRNAPRFSAYGYDEHVGTWESPEPDPNITGSNWIWSPQDLVKRWDRTHYFVDHALDFLKRHKDQGPCYVEIWPDDVHTPWVPNLQREAENPKSEELRDFAAVLGEYDYQMGRLFAGLTALGLDENTLIVFTSDNGPLPSFNHARTGGLRGSKLSNYEGGIRVPFIVRWPGHVPAGRVDERSVLEMVDLFPTFCALAGAQPPAAFHGDGENMTAVLTAAAPPQARTIFWEYGRASKFFNYPGKPYDRSPHLAVREGDWKLLVNQDGTGTQFFNVTADPNETRDVAAAHPADVNRLRAAALSWRRSLPAYAAPAR